MKQKSKVLDFFKVFKSLIENSFRKNIKSIIYDKGVEYIKTKFEYYCESEGIQMEHSVPYTPHQDGVAKRKNRSSKEMETCLLHDKNISPSLWAEDVKCASYLQNRVPQK